MRISTTMSFDLGAAAMNRQQGELLRLQQQLSTGRRVLSAADDPSAAARAVELTSGAARNLRYIANQDSARTSLTQLESTLGNFATELEDVRALLIQAGNGAYADQERANLAADLEARGAYLLSLANTRDANGAWIFSGFQEGVQAFHGIPGGATFQGDQGWREVQVSDGRTLPVTASGANIFERVPQGNGVFATQAATANAGSGVIDAGTVVDATQLQGHDYELQFHSVGGATTFDVVDTTLGMAISSGNTYSVGGAVSFGGMQMQITGTPAGGDRFTVKPSRFQSVFATIADVVTVLRTPAPTPAAKAQLNMAIGRAVSGVDRGMEAVLLARSGAGAGLRELDTLRGLAEGRDLQYQTEKSRLLDVDYAAAVSDLTRIQATSEAAQKAFVAAMNRSLFDLI